MRNEYTNIESQADLDALIERSAEGPVFLFKHSTTCPISGSAESEYAAFAAGGPNAVCGFLDLRAHRDISDAIEESLGIRHESPQAILVVNGSVVWDASHHGITAAALAAALTDAAG